MIDTFWLHHVWTKHPHLDCRCLHMKFRQLQNRWIYTSFGRGPGVLEEIDLCKGLQGNKATQESLFHCNPPTFRYSEFAGVPCFSFAATSFRYCCRDHPKLSLKILCFSEFFRSLVKWCQMIKSEQLSHEAGQVCTGWALRTQDMQCRVYLVRDMHLSKWDFRFTHPWGEKGRDTTKLYKTLIMLTVIVWDCLGLLGKMERYGKFAKSL